MTKVILGHDVAQLDVGRHRYGGNTPGRVFDVTPVEARAVVAAGGAYASLAGATRRAVGYRCGACGFGSVVKMCSRCGEECVRE